MSRQAYSIFCDDIRHEIGGKQSFMGTYTSKMFVPHFPITLPKLCLIINATTPIENPFKKILFRVLRDEEIFSEGEIEESELAKLAALTPDSEQNLISASVQFVFSPFQIEGPCTLRVRVLTEDEEIKAAGLRIELGNTI